MPNLNTRLFDSYGDDFVIATILRDVNSFGSNAESPLPTVTTLIVVTKRRWSYLSSNQDRGCWPQALAAEYTSELKRKGIWSAGHYVAKQ